MAFTNPSVSSSNLRKQLIAFALAFAPKSCCCPWGGSVRGFLHPWASFATSPCLSPQPPAPVCTLILILNHRADTACKCTEWFKLVFSVCKCSVLWLLRGTWNICSLVSDIFENSKRGRLFAAWARVACGAAGPVGEQLHIHEGKGFFLDGGQAAECRVSVSSAAQPYPIPSAQLQQSLLFKRFVWKLHYLSACLKLSLQSLVLCGLVIQRGEPGCCSQSLGKELGSREGTQSLLLPLSTSNPTFSWLPRAPYCSWWDFSVCPRAIRWLRSLLCKQDRQKQLKHLLLSPECPARLLSGEASQGYLQGWCWAWCCFHISPNGPSSRLGERRSGWCAVWPLLSWDALIHPAWIACLQGALLDFSGWGSWRCWGDAASPAGFPGAAPCGIWGLQAAAQLRWPEITVVWLWCCWAGPVSPGSRDTVQRLPGLQGHSALFLQCLAAPQAFRHTSQH